MKKEFSLKEQLEIIRKNGLNIQYIENPTDKEKWETINGEPYTIEIIKNSTEEMKISAIKYEYRIFEKFNSPTNAMKVEVIKQCSDYIYFVGELEEKSYLELIKENPFLILGVKKLTNKIIECCETKLNNY